MHQGDDLTELGNINESELNQVVLVGTIVGIFSVLLHY